VSHEKSETVKRGGKWVNVYGRGLPKAGQQLPVSRSHDSEEEAVTAAKKRSNEYNARDFSKPLPTRTLSNKISGKNTAPKPTLEQRLRHSGKYQSGAPRG